MYFSFKLIIILIFILEEILFCINLKMWSTICKTLYIYIYLLVDEGVSS